MAEVSEVHQPCCWLILTSEFRRLAEHARNKAAKLDASWRKDQLEAKRAALLKEMKQNEQEMAQIDHIEHTLPHSAAAVDSTLASALDASASTADGSSSSIDASAAPRPPRKVCSGTRPSTAPPPPPSAPPPLPPSSPLQIQNIPCSTCARVPPRPTPAYLHAGKPVLPSDHSSLRLCLVPHP